MREMHTGLKHLNHQRIIAIVREKVKHIVKFVQLILGRKIELNRSERDKRHIINIAHTYAI